jgi:hypothetical protein
MEKITVIVSNLVNSVQVIVDVLINLVFQPVFALLTIIQSLIEIWSATDETEEEELEPQQNVTEYPSVNAGRPYPEEVDPPVFTHIGFKINQTEQDELNKIRKELNQ